MTPLALCYSSTMTERRQSTKKTPKKTAKRAPMDPVAAQLAQLTSAVVALHTELRMLAPMSVDSLREFHGLAADIAKKARAAMSPETQFARDLAASIVEIVREHMWQDIMERATPLLPVMLSMLPDEQREVVARAFSGE